MSNNDDGLKRDLGLWTAIFVVVASMIGAGIFGNTGIIQKEVGHPLIVMGLWFLGGMIALAGAMSYSELATMMPHAGGEYVYLKKIYGNIPSFLSGWVSFLVGFSAHAATAAILSSDYLYEFLRVVAPGSTITYAYEDSWVRKLHSISLIVIFSYFHMLSVKKGGAIQNALTFVKLVLVIVFTTAGLGMAFSGNGVIPSTGGFLTGTPRIEGMGVGLLYVMFAYSGWNGATYLAGEIKDPEKNLPRALFRGTLIITTLYLLMNVLYYMAVPSERLSGEPAVAALASDYLFGNNVTMFFNLAFFMMLLSSLSVSIMIGPRVYYAMAKDNLFFSIAGKLSKRNGTPIYSIAIQGLLAIIYVLVGSYEQILIFLEFAISIFPVFTVYGLIKLRREQPELRRPYQTPLFPIIPIFFIFFILITMVTAFLGRPQESASAIFIVLLGIPAYYLWKYIQRFKVEKP